MVHVSESGVDFSQGRLGLRENKLAFHSKPRVFLFTGSEIFRWNLLIFIFPDSISSFPRRGARPIRAWERRNASPAPLVRIARLYLEVRAHTDFLFIYIPFISILSRLSQLQDYILFPILIFILILWAIIYIDINYLI